jgi:hypothetical protein
MTPQARKRFNELVAEFVALRKQQRAPSIPQACRLVADECGVKISREVFKAAVADHA